MGSITRGLSNNITTGGVILPAGITNASVSAVTSFANASGGTLILLSTQTASNSASISFTTGLNSTYDEYVFKFINLVPRDNNGNQFHFQGSTDGGTNYGIAITSTFFIAIHSESDASTNLAYDTNRDLAQSTAFQTFTDGTGGATDGNTDKNASGTLTLFNPSSTTYVKHFIGVCNNLSDNDVSRNEYVAGYFNTTSAINAIRFKHSGVNFDGIIKMYGVKKS
jgi:hypothetical protein